MSYKKGMKIIFYIGVFLLTQSVLFAQNSVSSDTLAELVRRIDILTEEIETIKLGRVEEAEKEYESHLGMGPAASKVYQSNKTGVSLAGYGEMVYQNIKGDTPDVIDYLRHVVYFGYRFNDWLLFNSEIETEHANSISVEFGYIEARLNPLFNIKGGMLLIPVGWMNELHEPPTFHGSLRPMTEVKIIPSTWRANGFGISGQSEQGIGYKLYVTESLNANSFSASGIRSGRQKGSKALANDFGVSGRLYYAGAAGFNIGGSFFVGNTGQDLFVVDDKSLAVNLKLFSAHVMYARHGLELRGLFASSFISDIDQLNQKRNLVGNQSIGEGQFGYYATIAYDLMPAFKPGSTHYLAPFFQFEKLNTQASVPDGYSKNQLSELTNFTVGLTYKPHANVALKADFIKHDFSVGKSLDQFNVAVTYLY